MNRFFHMMRLASSVIKSRGFAVSVLAVLMSLTVYAVSSTTNTVYIRADQQTKILTTSQRDLDAILEECGISVSQHDTVDFSGFDGNVAEINITRAFPVVIRADNTTYQVMMTEGTVADALAKAGVSIDDDDLISHPLYEFLEKNERIFINRIDYRTMSYEEEIPYEVEIRTTPLLRNGKSRLLQEGATGKKILTYGETTKDGVVQEAELLGENIVLKPTTQLHLVGGDVPVSPYDFGYTIVNNAPTSYKSDHQHQSHRVQRRRQRPRRIRQQPFCRTRSGQSQFDSLWFQTVYHLGGRQLCLWLCHCFRYRHRSDRRNHRRGPVL